MLFNNKLLVAVLTMATMVTYSQAQDLLKTDPEVIKLCDFNGDGKINIKSDYKQGLVDKQIIIKENRCHREKSIEKGKEDIEKGKEDIEKLKIIDKLLSNK